MKAFKHDKEVFFFIRSELGREGLKMKQTLFHTTLIDI